jgi:hypothetical protein
MAEGPAEPAPTPPDVPARAPKGCRSRGSESIEGKVPRQSPAQKVIAKTERVVEPVESAKAEAARLKREGQTHEQSLWERRKLFHVGIAIVLVILVVAVVILVWSSDPRLTSWAAATLSSILTAPLAYAVGRSQGKETGK